MKTKRKAGSPGGAGSPRKTGSSGIKNNLRRIGRGAVVCMLAGIMLCCLLADLLTVWALRFLQEDSIDLGAIKLGYTTILYADGPDGAPVELRRIQTDQNRIWTDYEDLPVSVRDALIAVEDKRFMEHHGVDWKRTIGAMVNLVIPIYDSKQGGSTLTQQVVRGVSNDKQRTIPRKAREILRAMKLEQDYSKEQIVEMYLNTAYFGNNAYGVQAAANTYFQKKAGDLSLAESASIIGITQFPDKYDPFTHPEENKRRQEHILKEMRDQGKISQSVYQAAVGEPLEFNRDRTATQVNQVYSWFEDYVIETVINDLAAKYGYSYGEAEELCNRGGLRIYSTVSPDLQEKVTAYYSSAENFPKVNNAEYPQSAFVVLSPEGRVLAVAGGIGEKDGMRQFNRATQAVRQCGSAIKPLAAYLQGFENHLVTWSTLIDDHPILLKQNGADVLWPANYQGDYQGPITVDQAIRQSRNTVAVKLVDAVGPEQTFAFLKSRLGFENLREGASNDENLSAMGLGGMAYGVTPLEMAGAYQIYANGGYYTKPYCYTQVLDARGQVLLEADTTRRRVISAETATVMNRLLQRVTTAGTGTAARFGAMPVAGKTGTTTDNYDQWFVGVTPYMVTATWMGYDTPAEIDYRWQNYPPPVVFQQLASQLHEGLPAKDFPVWGKAVSRTYCADTGNLAGPGCPNRAEGWYAEGALPPDCTLHQVEESKELFPAGGKKNGAKKGGGKKERPGYVQLPSGLWVKEEG